MNSSILTDTLINGPARYAQVHQFESAHTSLPQLAMSIIELGAIILICRLLWLLVSNIASVASWLLRLFGVGKSTIDYTILQLTFPSTTKKSAYATEQLHTILGSLVSYTGFWDRFAARKQPYSLEIVATKDEGIRYLIRIPTYQAEIAQRTLLSYLPGIKLHQTADYMTSVSGGWVAELALTSDYVLPLGDNKTISEHDMITYLTGHMRKLRPDELVVYQVVTVRAYTETHRAVLRRCTRFLKRIAQGKTVSTELKGPHGRVFSLLFWTLVAPLYAILMTLKYIGYFIQGFFMGSSARRRNDVYAATAINPHETKISELISMKLEQPLFEVSIRLLVISSDEVDAAERLKSLVTAFEAVARSVQTLRVRRLSKRSRQKLIERVKERSLSPHLLSYPTIVSSSELSDLYHLPNTSLTKTEDLIKSRSRELPAPLSMKQTTSELDVVIGSNQFDGQTRHIGLTKAQREKHMYVIGKTGTGKTTLLVNAIKQDMQNDKGVAVLDPHGDMFRELLSLVPEHRIKDVVVFDPSDREFPVGLNILDPGIDFLNEDDAHEWITSAVISVFSKLSEKSQWGPRMEHILRSTTMTALQTPNPTLYTMQRLLTDKSYQREVAKTLKDPVLKQFWDKEFKLMGTMQLSSATAPLTHRLGHFLTSTMSRHILLQQKSTIRMSEIMNEGKILLINLSKGDIGEDQSFFFGTLLTSAMWMAAYQRTKLPERDRRDFYVYVDEFQNFATPQFGDIMSEGRKFHISLTVSHQNIAQIEDASLVKVVTGNVGTLVSLKVSPQDESFLLPYFQPEVEKGDIVNLPPYHFFMKVTGDESEDAFSGQTIRPEESSVDGMGEAAFRYSREQYSITKEEATKRVSSLLENEIGTKTAPAKVRSKKVDTKTSSTPKTKREKREL